jgi:hypothetical protein
VLNRHWLPPPRLACGDLRVLGKRELDQYIALPSSTFGMFVAFKLLTPAFDGGDGEALLTRFIGRARRARCSSRSPAPSGRRFHRQLPQDRTAILQALGQDCSGIYRERCARTAQRSAASVMRPRGGAGQRTPMTSSTPFKLQKEFGLKRGNTKRTLEALAFILASSGTFPLITGAKWTRPCRHSTHAAWPLARSAALNWPG